MYLAMKKQPMFDNAPMLNICFGAGTTQQCAQPKLYGYLCPRPRLRSTSRICMANSVADPDPLGSRPFWSDPDPMRPDPDLVPDPDLSLNK
jgi:hypothetical protein